MPLNLFRKFVYYSEFIYLYKYFGQNLKTSINEQPPNCCQFRIQYSTVAPFFLLNKADHCTKYLISINNTIFNENISPISLPFTKKLGQEHLTGVCLVIAYQVRKCYIFLALFNQAVVARYLDHNPTRQIIDV